MGRGRAKAKQTKVARQLKYGGMSTDLDALRHELGTSEALDHAVEAEEPDEDDDEYSDVYAKYADLDEDDEDAV
jgi:hypothetical protein